MNIYIRTIIVYSAALITFVLTMFLNMVFNNVIISFMPFILFIIVTNYVKRKEKQEHFQRGIITIKKGELTLPYVLFNFLMIAVVMFSLYLFMTYCCVINN